MRTYTFKVTGSGHCGQPFRIHLTQGKNSHTIRWVHLKRWSYKAPRCLYFMGKLKFSYKSFHEMIQESYREIRRIQNARRDN